ncbi:MAG: S-layer homology domain-containing protein [Candidatus Peribacteraceae bacterium]
MRRLSPLVPLLALVPALAFALDFTPVKRFVDVRETSREAAGISLLAREGIVQGYSGKYFGPSRRINRAEFLKIAMMSAGKNGTAFTPKTCFLDVREGDWFSPYICAAKDQSIVKGRTPERFQPEDTVSYGEALKMLTLLYGYKIPMENSADWAEPYYLAAADHETDIPVTIRLDSPLTRGLAARLVGAFLAESKGELDRFRLAESGIYPSSSSQSSSSTSASSASLASAKPSGEDGSFFTLPPVSHFLVVGRASDALASATIRSVGETAHIAAVQVKFFAEARSVKRFELTTLTGSVVAVLKQRTTNDTSDYKQIYEAQINANEQVQIPADTDVPLVLRALVRGIDDNGFSDELLEVRSFIITFIGDQSNETKSVVTPPPFPKHQVAFGRLARIERISPENEVLASGTGVVVSAFGFTADVIPEKTLSLTQLIFTLQRSGDFSVQNWRIGRQGSSLEVPCTSGQDSTLTCSNLSDVIGVMKAGVAILELRADIAVPRDSVSHMLQTSLIDPGSPSSLGSVQWTDQSGEFRWVEGHTPLVWGTLLR